MDVETNVEHSVESDSDEDATIPSQLNKVLKYLKELSSI